MKPESLNALVLDRELGELSPEAAELLDHYLAEQPESAAAARSLRGTVAATRAAVRRFPELARPEADSAPDRLGLAAVRLPSGPRFNWTPLALAASVMILLGGAAWLGFRAGEDSAQRAEKPVKPPPALHTRTVQTAGPWTRYALATDPRGGLTVVRRNLNPQP